MKRHFLLLCWWCSLATLSYSQVSGSIEVSASEVSFSQYDGFDFVNLSSATYTTEPGKPQLPVIVRSYVLPINTRVTGIRIEGLEKTPIAGSYYLYPAQPPVPTDGGVSSAFVGPDPSVYETDTPYPVAQAEVISDQYSFGYHVVTVRFFPLEYLPRQRQLNLCHFRFTIDYAPEAVGERITPLRQPQRRAALIREQIRTSVSNPADIDRFAPEVPIVQEQRENSRFTPPATDFSRSRAIPRGRSADSRLPYYYQRSPEAGV